MYILDVYIARANVKIGNSFKYLSHEKLEKGRRVRVDFHHRQLLGFVDAITYTDKSIEELEAEYGYAFKFIDGCVDQKAIINDELYELAKWMTRVFVAPFTSCINTILPKVNSVTRNTIAITKERYIKKQDFDPKLKLTKKQMAVYQELKDELSYHEYLSLYKTIGKKLIELGLVEVFEKNKDYKLNKAFTKTNFKQLTTDQSAAVQSVIESDKLVSLLFGVTGSGKTEVYLHIARFMIKQQRQVLILVPEIALTPQMIQRVSERFERVCFYHSGLNAQEQYNQYLKVAGNEVDIVVGTRSSIFLPFDNLGIIIVDEEHDHSYYQNNLPCYQVKDIAIRRATTHKAKVLLASATPSLKSYAMALNGSYNFVKLPQRINNDMPTIKLVDTIDELKKGSLSIIGSYLKQRISDELKHNHQIIILLNRRGYSPIIKCGNCNEVYKCDSCDLALVYHQEEKVMKCHYCGRIYPYQSPCKHCHYTVGVSYGFGTEKVQEELQALFPNANIERFDRDTVNKKGSHEVILKAFEKQSIDILVGTQMIAKGLDYPNVTLVGVVDGDQGFQSESYRAMEDVFCLLMQASGRSGRSDLKGEVVIQTHNQDHYLFQSLIKHDYDSFFKQEMKFRSYLSYPPYTHMVSFKIEAVSIRKLNESMEVLLNIIDYYQLKHFRPYEMQRLNNLHRLRVIAVDKDIKKIIILSNKIVEKYLENRNVANIMVEMDPLEI